MTAPKEWAISEDDLARSQPTVRAQTVARLEQLWTLAQEQVEHAQDSGRPVDPRWAELGLRVLRTEAEMYRLAKPPVAIEDDAEPYGGVDPAQVVQQALTEIRARMGHSEELG